MSVSSIGDLCNAAIVPDAGETPVNRSSKEDRVIQVIYRWRVKEGEENAFVRAWSQGTRVIRSTFTSTSWAHTPF